MHLQPSPTWYLYNADDAEPLRLLDDGGRAEPALGTLSPWYMLQPSLPLKSAPMERPSREARGPSRPLPAG
jgi:hypothetical protein